MYSIEDLERFYFQYQTDVMPNGISIEQFCLCNKVSYYIRKNNMGVFDKYLKKRRE